MLISPANLLCEGTHHEIDCLVIYHQLFFIFRCSSNGGFGPGGGSESDCTSVSKLDCDGE